MRGIEGTEFNMTDCVHSPDATGFVPYCEHLEQPGHDEDQLIKKIADVLHGNNEWAFKKYRHGIRDAHAKSHGILRGELTIYPDLPEPYRQGLFATPGPYPVIARLSSTSGALRSDETRGIRGLGIKVLGVPGDRALPDDTATTQDFILVTHREFPFADARAYLKRGMPLAVLLARLPDSVLILSASSLARSDRSSNVHTFTADDTGPVQPSQHPHPGHDVLLVSSASARQVRCQTALCAAVEKREGA